MKIIFSLFLTISFTAQSSEIIRDIFFEEYMINLIKYENDIDNIYLIESKKPNAFVIDKSIYFTKEILNLIKDEDTLKAILYHEYGHIYHNHTALKKVENINLKKNRFINNLLSLGVAVVSGNPNVGLASNLAINQKIMNDISRHSIKFEIQADDFMHAKIKKEKINTNGLIDLLNNLPNNKNNYFQSHPDPLDRINLLAKYKVFSKKENSISFEWIKAKYFQNSSNERFNNFFRELNKGSVNLSSVDLEIEKDYINYEIYKHGLKINNLTKLFLNIIEINQSPYLKIEFFNYIIDENLEEFFYLIDQEKNKKGFQNEYFYYLIIGKYYNKIKNYDLSNFYLCQFYTLINIKNKTDYFCNIYDIKDIPKEDIGYGIFK